MRVHAIWLLSCGLACAGSPQEAGVSDPGPELLEPQPDVSEEVATDAVGTDAITPSDGTSGPILKGVFELVSGDFVEHHQYGVGAPASKPGALTAAQVWTPTGLEFVRGALLLVEATGTVSGRLGPGGETRTVDAEGIYGWFGGDIYPIVNRTPFALFGRLGGSVFLVGSGNVILAPEGGELELGVAGHDDSP